MISTTELTKLPTPQPQQTEAVYLTADETLLQFVVDYYFRKYARYFSMSGQEAGVGYAYSIPSSPKIDLAPLPPQVQAQAPKSNTLCTVDTVQCELTFPDRKLSYTARVDILATCFLAGPRLMMKVDKVVASTDGQVDPTASKLFERVVVPVLVKWLESILLPELTQTLGDQFQAIATSATVEADQVNSHARLVYQEEGTRLGMALLPTDMTPIAGAGRVRAVLREDAVNMAAAALTPKEPFTAHDKASYSVFSGKVEAKLWLKDPSVNISGDRAMCKLRMKAKVSVEGKVSGIGASISLSDECVAEAPLRLKVADKGDKLAISLGLDRSDVNFKLEGDWGPLEFARKALNKTVMEMLDDAVKGAVSYLGHFEINVLDISQMAHKAGLDVDITPDEAGFGNETLYGQFTLRERS